MTLDRSGGSGRGRVEPTTGPVDLPGAPDPARIRALIGAYYLILAATVFLVVIGSVMVVSSKAVTALAEGESPYAEVVPQLRFVALGLVGAFVLSRLPMRSKFWPYLALGAFLLALVVQSLIFTSLGVTIGGNTNWIKYKSIQFQPSEFLKLALVLWLGVVLANKRHRLWQWGTLFMPALLSVGAAIGLVVLGHDAGTASVLGLFSVCTLVIAGVPWRRMAVIAPVAVAGGFVVMRMSDNRWMRVEVVLHPELCQTPGNNCWQINQAAYGLASGGLWGRGLGASRQKWAWLSQADSDFIFAIIGEELGLIGCLVILALFALLAFGLFQVVRLHPDRFAQITTGAIASWILSQAIINIGMVIRVLPVIGVPLPFVSAGGSALVASMLAMGVVLGLIRGEPVVGAALRIRPSARGALGVFARRARAARPSGPARTGKSARAARSQPDQLTLTPAAGSTRLTQSYLGGSPSGGRATAVIDPITGRSERARRSVDRVTGLDPAGAEE